MMPNKTKGKEFIEMKIQIDISVDELKVIKEKEPCGNKAQNEIEVQLKEVNQTLRRLQEILLYFSSLKVRSLTSLERQVAEEAMTEGVRAWSRYLSREQ